MLEVTLESAIVKFVKTFRVVRKDHLYKFFSDWDDENVERTVTRLCTTKVLFGQPNGLVSSVMQLHCDIGQYDNQLKALDVLCLMKSNEVRWFDVADYPLDIRFLTSEDEVFDVAVLDENWANKYALLPQTWKRGIPPGQEDIFNHVAVVSNLDVAQKVRDLGFNQFALIDKNNHVTIYDAD